MCDRNDVSKSVREIEVLLSAIDDKIRFDCHMAHTVEFIPVIPKAG